MRFTGLFFLLLLATLAASPAAAADSKIDEAIEGYIPHGEKGEMEAQNTLGDLYAVQGYDAYRRAEMWYRKAANQGDSRAQNSLGDFYHEGKALERDDNEAAKWYAKAAAQNNPDAQNSLGDLYQEGATVKRDDAEAFKWYNMAAAQGFPPSQFSLALMYEAGRGVKQDYVQAYMWYTIASERSKHAESYITTASARKIDLYQIQIRDAGFFSPVPNSLREKMTPDQIVEGKRLARDWQPVVAPAAPPVPLQKGDEVLVPLHFKGSTCTYTCGDHRAGYRWARLHTIPDADHCGGKTQSFIDGCNAFVNESKEADKKGEK